MPNGGQHDTRVSTRAACLAVNKAATASYRDLPPPDFDLSATSSDTIKFALTSPVPDADTYDIQRSMNGVSWTLVETGRTADFLAEYLDGAKTAEEKYYYQARAVNPHGKSKWSIIKGIKTPAVSKAVAGQTTITGAGFGPAPNVVLNRYLTGVEGGSVPDAPDTAIGEVGSFAPSTNRPLISANGSVGVAAVVPGTQAAAGKLEYQHPTEVRRFRIYYEESVPQGKFVPGWKTTPALRTFANASGMKNLWLLQHADAAPAGAGTDYAIASCTTYGERILAGNNVNHTAAPYWWSGSKATYDKHWDWDGWNAFDVVNGCDLAAPTTGTANHRMTFTSAITDATLKPTGTEIQTWSNPGFEGASTDADAFYKLFKLNAYARVQFDGIQIAFRNFYLAVESADNAGDYAQMAFLGNASTLEACTKRKPKVADSWTDTEVAVSVTSDEASEFTHVFVQRADGTVEAKQIGEVGGANGMSYNAPGGLVDTQSLVVDVDEAAAGFNFGTGPTKRIALGFGVGPLYEQGDGTSVSSHIDPVTGESWDFENLNRVVAADSGIKWLYSENLANNGTSLGSGMINWDYGSAIHESTPVLMSSLARATCTNQVNLTQWKSYRIKQAKNLDGGNRNSFYNTFQTRQAVITAKSKPNSSGGFSDFLYYTGSVGLAPNKAIDRHVVWLQPGTVDTKDGTAYTQSIYPSDGLGIRQNFGDNSNDFNGLDTQQGVMFYESGSPDRWRWLMVQDFLNNSDTQKIWRTDMYWQVGSLSRFELANAALPADTTEAYFLPVKVHGANRCELHLWKSLFTDYAGLHVHFYDDSGTFKGSFPL